jgi:hypothetical protein
MAEAQGLYLPFGLVVITAGTWGNLCEDVKNLYEFCVKHFNMVAVISMAALRNR